MSSGRKVRSAVKSIESIKAAVTIVGLLLGCILILWIVTRLMQPKEPPPDHTPRPGKAMWEEPAAAR
jgi:hypothetical protein